MQKYNRKHAQQRSEKETGASGSNEHGLCSLGVRSFRTENRGDQIAA
jgi:hypothetical protein